ncbi:hypothetical protein P9112_008901 [Eukaryota sp. TZLM1-RC]
MLKIVGYMDDISIIGPLNVLNEIASEASLFYKKIGLLLNPDKCPLLDNEKDSLIIDNVEIPFVNYSSDASMIQLEISSIVCLSLLRIFCYLEPLLSRLVDDDALNSFGRNRGDLMLEALDGTTIITVVRSTDVCNYAFIPLAQSKHKNPLSVFFDQNFNFIQNL